MLREFYRLRDLNFSRLMEVYLEGNVENGMERYPNEEASVQRIYAEQDFFRYLEQDFFQTPGAYYCVWMENGEYCAALRFEPFADGILLEALETAPNLRRNGYARKLMRAALTSLSEKTSLPVYSHVSKQNIASIRTHTACGFVKHLEYAAKIDGSVSNHSYTLVYGMENKTLPSSAKMS